MNTTDLIDIVNKQMDESFPDNEIIPLFNMCLMDLSPLRDAPFTLLVDRHSEPELESFFRDMLVYYAIGHLQFKEEDYDERPDRLNRYYQRKQEYKSYLTKQAGPHEIEDVYGVI